MLTQFPLSLRELIWIRLIAAIGGGGVIYLTPMVFHQEAFSASSVTQGLALAALAGTLGRLLSGALLDRGTNCSIPVLMAVLMFLLADGHLLSSQTFDDYLLGQVGLGFGLGLYWPAIELAVPLSCAPLSSANAFALVRSADALGVATGTLVGAALAALGWLRGIYPLDMVCLAVVAMLLVWKRLPDPKPQPDLAQPLCWQQWLPPLLPLLLVAIVATAMPALMQSALPLDLVQGGLARAAISEGMGALTIGLQLGLLLLFQWPVGRLLAQRPVASGLIFSLSCFVGGNLLLAASALVSWGLIPMVAAQIPLALGTAAFLPTATEAVVQLSPASRQGVAMAFYSQCFGISGFSAPLLAGWLLDSNGHGVLLWLIMAAICGLSIRLAARIKPCSAPAIAASPQPF